MRTSSAATTAWPASTAASAFMSDQAGWIRMSSGPNSARSHKAPPSRAGGFGADNSRFHSFSSLLCRLVRPDRLDRREINDPVIRPGPPRTRRTVVAEAGGEPSVLHRRDGDDRQRSARRLGLSPRLGRLRAPHAETHGVESGGQGARSLPGPKSRRAPTPLPPQSIWPPPLPLVRTGNCARARPFLFA